MNITINEGIIRIELPFSELVAIATKNANASAVHQTQKIASAIRRTARTTKTLKSTTGPALQQAILVALSGETWMKAEELKKRVKSSRDSFTGARDVLLKTGKLERRGKKRATEYRLRGTLSNRVAKKSAAKKPAARQGATAR